MALDLIEGKPRDLGGFSVLRVLPSFTHHPAATLPRLTTQGVDVPRRLEWNFVASSRAAIAFAREAWEGYPHERFPRVPNETQLIPLPPQPMQLRHHSDP